MIDWILNTPRTSALQILCLGAHSDDLEIGCGGTILTMTQQIVPAHVTWVVFSGNASRRQEAVASANAFLADAAKREIRVESYRDGFFPYTGAEIKEYFEALKTQIAPDIIFTHCRNDLHQDHRLICELTWNTFRNHCILEYEIPKYDGDLGSPNLFVPLSPAVARKKIDSIMEHFTTQAQRHWFSPDLFASVLRIRGMESCAESGLAEAFYARKVVIRQAGLESAAPSSLIR